MSQIPVSYIAGTGLSVPEKIMTNHDLEKIVDTTDEWIVSRTGIKTRHIVSEGVLTSDISKEASEIALKEAGVSPEDLDFIIVGTVSGDVSFPATACYVQEKIGAVNAAAFDITAACSGFLYSLIIGNGLFAAGNVENILVIGAETLSRITNWKDRNTCVLFGDGAGAAVLKKSKGDKGILATFMKSDGRLSQLLMNPGSINGQVVLDSKGEKMLPFINMQGREVFKNAIRSMEEAISNVLEQGNVSIKDIDLLVPHQANVRILDLLAERTGIGKGKIFINVDRYGNTSSASVPIALDEARKEGLLPEGSLCVMAAFGGGFTWGAVLVRF